MGVLAGAALSLGGCEKALFTNRYERTPYERYQVLRGDYREPMQQNAWGAEEPALRRRLQPLEVQ